jgi:hypothetical protein
MSLTVDSIYLFIDDQVEAPTYEELKIAVL